MQYNLFTVNIGPISEFVASTTQSRDLWFGSWLLSELAKTVTRTIAEQEGLTSLIVPAPHSFEALAPESELNVGPTIVARIGTEPTKLAEIAQAAMHAQLAQLAETTLARVSGPLLFDEALAQIHELVEWYWAALPLAEIDLYSEVRAHLEALIAACRRTRIFTAAPSHNALLKSSIDGRRESVIPEEQYAYLSPAQLYDQYGITASERLSGVDLLKRHGWVRDESRFPSTSHIAALPLLQRIGMKDLARTQQAWATYRRVLEQAAVKLERLPAHMPHHPILESYEGNILFGERLTERVSDRGELGRVQHARQVFLKEAADGLSPYPYFVILAADGDRVGAAVAAQQSPEQHRRLSAALATFALSVNTIVEQYYQGALIYAAGDDVLAFLPLHTAITCAAEVAASFSMALHEFTGINGISPTLSIGIAIMHHLDRLSDALDRARVAVRVAKAEAGRNALAVTVSKRGLDTTVAGRWGTLDRRLLAFTQLYRSDHLPDSAAYTLRSLVAHLAVPAEHPNAEVLAHVQRAEARRLLQRARVERGQRGLDNDVLMVLNAALDDLSLPLSQLADELAIAREFALGLEQADVGG